MAGIYLFHPLYRYSLRSLSPFKINDEFARYLNPEVIQLRLLETGNPHGPVEKSRRQIKENGGLQRSLDVRIRTIEILILIDLGTRSCVGVSMQTSISAALRITDVHGRRWARRPQSTGQFCLNPPSFENIFYIFEIPEGSTMPRKCPCLSWWSVVKWSDCTWGTPHLEWYLRWRHRNRLCNTSSPSSFQHSIGQWR